jgi:PTS system nitrogen regulatory IIA component
MPWDIAASFVILGRSDGGIPFGAEDGSLTRLFMLICCKDERTHLHVLARISRMFDDATLAAVMAAGDAEAIRQVLQSREAAILATE